MPNYPNPPHQSSNAPAQVTLTWSPGDEELIANGNFEMGVTAGWTHLNATQEANSNTYINNGSRDPASPDAPSPPFAGNYSVVTDPFGPGLISIYQELTIPSYAQSAVLTWADRVRNHFDSYFNLPDPNPQEYRVEIRQPNNSTLATAFRTEPGDPLFIPWTKRSFDMSGFAGQRVRIVFQTVQTRFFFNAHLDNVSLRVIPAVVPVYEVFFGANSVLGTNDLLISTTNRSAALPALSPRQTSFWRVNTRIGTNQTVGPVWRFSTAPASAAAKLVFSLIPEQTSQRLPVTLSVVDKRLNPVGAYNNQATLAAFRIAGSTQGMLLGDAQPLTSVTSSRSTVGYSFRPSADLLVSHFRHFTGEKVSLWSEDGLLLVSVQVTNVAGAWGQTRLNSPVQLYSGERYWLGAYSSAPLATNFAQVNGSGAFDHGSLLQSYEGLGDAMPLTEHPARWWLVDLVYTANTLSPVPVSPNGITFTNGGWAGEVSVSAISGPVILAAQAESGVRGLSPVFVLFEDSDSDGIPNEWEVAHGLDKDDASDATLDLDSDGSTNRDEYRAGTDPQNDKSVLRISLLERRPSDLLVHFLTVEGKIYRLQRSANLMSWDTLPDQIIGGGRPAFIQDISSSSAAFYRLIVQ